MLRMASSLEERIGIQKLLTRMKNIKSISPVSSRHIPQRTCVACRKVKTKGKLIRLVRTTAGNIEIDGSGKEAGRGAYLCRAWECWEAGLRGNQLEHSVRGKLTEDNREQLIKNAKGLLKGAN
ncbi:YlxR family protein [Chloroflexota bacterium]